MFAIRKSQFAWGLFAFLLLGITSRLVFVWLYLYKLFFFLASLPLPEGIHLLTALTAFLHLQPAVLLSAKVNFAYNLQGTRCP